jgi:GntR family transcriptional repressor for pyruvate dehydrogenase complex
MPPQIDTSTLVDRVTDEIRRMILTEELQPGDFLPTRKELAARFDVGLSTVHEAIQALTAVGMLESRPGKGTWVREDALHTLIHPAVVKTRLGELGNQKIYDARSVIEIALTEFAAQQATPEDIERIENAMSALEAAVQDDEAFVEADLEFHLAVARAGHNELLEQFYHLSRKLLSGVIADMMRRVPGLKEDSIRLQEAIAQAVAQHDAQEARRAAIDHMEYFARCLSLDARDKQDT